MSLFSRLLEWLRSFGGDRRPPEQLERSGRSERSPISSVNFPDIRAVDKPPSNEKVASNTLYFVAPNGNPKWVLFRCPCGCSSVITLSLQQAHRPRWTLKISPNGRPILYPSVWRDVGCMSHFWVRDGRVHWCQDTGTYPY